MTHNSVLRQHLEQNSKLPVYWPGTGLSLDNAAMIAEWGIDIAVVGSGLINDSGTIAENLAAITAALDE